MYVFVASMENKDIEVSLTRGSTQIIDTKRITTSSSNDNYLTIPSSLIVITENTHMHVVIR